VNVLQALKQGRDVRQDLEALIDAQGFLAALDLLSDISHRRAETDAELGREWAIAALAVDRLATELEANNR
jgi:hypothetical protein